jgi:hypothetical protein
MWWGYYYEIRLPLCIGDLHESDIPMHPPKHTHCWHIFCACAVCPFIHEYMWQTSLPRSPLPAHRHM